MKIVINSDEDARKVVETLRKSPLANALFPQDTCSLQSIPVLKEIIETFEKHNKKKLRGQYVLTIPGYACWIKVDYEKVVTYNICNNGFFFKVTVVRFNDHLKQGLSETEILEKVNRANDICFHGTKLNRSSGMCAVYDKVSNRIYYKRSFMLPLVCEKFYEWEICFNVVNDVFWNARKEMEDIFEVN